MCPSPLRRAWPLEGHGQGPQGPPLHGRPCSAGSFKIPIGWFVRGLTLPLIHGYIGWLLVWNMAFICFYDFPKIWGYPECLWNISWYTPGWWLGTFFITFHILGAIIPTDEVHHFSEGWAFEEQFLVDLVGSIDIFPPSGPYGSSFSPQNSVEAWGCKPSEMIIDNSRSPVNKNGYTMIHHWWMSGWCFGTWLLLWNISKNGMIDPKAIDELHHFSRWLVHHQPDVKQWS